MSWRGISSGDGILMAGNSRACKRTEQFREFVNHRNNRDMMSLIQFHSLAVASFVCMWH